MWQKFVVRIQKFTVNMPGVRLRGKNGAGRSAMAALMFMTETTAVNPLAVSGDLMHHHLLLILLFRD